MLKLIGSPLSECSLRSCMGTKKTEEETQCNGQLMVLLFDDFASLYKETDAIIFVVLDTQPLAGHGSLFQIRVPQDVWR